MINAEELLKPITEEKPCGEDLYYDPNFQELEGLMKGKPETQFSDAEEPDWRALHERCLELFGRSKDLRVATTLCLSALKVEGLPSLRETLALLNGLVERYWEPLYPRLDPEDNNDPLYRMNILGALAAARGTFGDPMRFLERLREAPLSDSTQMGRFSLADIARSEAGQPAAEGQPPVPMAQIEAAFRDTPSDQLVGTHQILTDALKQVAEMGALLTRTVGPDKAPSFNLLEAELKGMHQRLAPYLPAGSVAASAQSATSGAAVAAEPAPARIAGEIQSRQDAVRMLERICDYYSREEPSSPVPNVLRRVIRLTDMNFLQIIQELCPDAESAVRGIIGEKPES